VKLTLASREFHASTREFHASTREFQTIFTAETAQGSRLGEGYAAKLTARRADAAARSSLTGVARLCQTER
jgi:hypothetical protein